VSDRAELAALQIADPPQAWEALGFTVHDGVLVLGGVEVWLDAAGRGITGWTLRHVPRSDDVDGLPTGVTTDPAAAAGMAHPNGAMAIDHVVVTTPDFDRTAQSLAAAEMPLRRIRDVTGAAGSGEDGAGGRRAGGSFRQGFRRLGPAILELVEVPNGPPGPARFWGLVVVVTDLEALRGQLSPHVSEIRDAVQPGRRIATLDAAPGISPRIAFMDPE
jgi:hypothetical protein